MRDSLTARIRWLRAVWFWPLALLALPNCTLDRSGICSTCGLNIDPGPVPWNGAVFCDIEKPGTEGRRCATPEEIGDPNLPRLAQGAIALVKFKNYPSALDYSEAAMTACGGPQIVTFEAPFPDGTPICANCASTITSVAAATSLCIQQCEDVTAPDVGAPADPALVADCTNRTHLSINAANPTFCFDGACDGLHVVEGFLTTRRSPEAPVWQNVQNVTITGPDGNTVTKNSGLDNSFDAGAAAASTHTITTRDGYLEFSAGSDTTHTRVVGLSHGDTDSDSDFATIDYGISLFKEGCFYVFEGGTQVNGTVETCSAPHAFGGYAADDAFRVSVKENLDGTATISYAKVTGLCTLELECPPFHTSVIPASYPLRVDASFREIGGQISNVIVVRIRP
jgi:hypothetical protein